MDNVYLVTKCFVVNEQGHILVLRRSKQSKVRPGEWDLPGGMVEHGEDPNVSNVREIKEETSIAANHINILTITTENKLDYILTFFYKASYEKGEVSLSDEHTNYKWISAEEFKGLDLPEKFHRAASQLDEFVV